ncbi:hypothetical protein SAMN02787079_02467 [Lysinibacillus sp. TC-37]|uniref:Lipoprotein n=2 Tax=Bacillaceae TaxID=186817 RepID=A0A2I0V0W4_9BACI|nr:hypothetical protein AK833_17100 [Lysinibacillus sp. F5]PKU51958.1 hypothetical protein CRI88_06195 [Lysinibacillus fusiformis]SCY76651.1 hypothetical protein SAMN02787078_02450 [Lysinibacillus sp. SG9]SDB33343.1 hypothetical protein SAMN02787079_02467 [Lysinibacillus sp. TC-37]SFS95681.1 hypothetical protein SAMN02787087_02751 [Lysinibacillus sp. SG55]
MKWMTKVACITCICALLTGCGDRLAEIRDAASGINSAANSAASAVSRDVHAMRAIDINYQDTSFTVNDLFKTILRDIRWDYDLEKNELHVRGTWQPPLFSDQPWDGDMKEKLAEAGFVTVTCKFIDDKIDSKHTNVILTYNEEILLQENGEEALHHLYDTYLLP